MQNKSILELLAKHAQLSSKSKKTSDIFFSMIKLSQSDKLYDEMLSLPEKRIKDILSEPGKYEYKKNDLRKILNDNLNILSTYAFTKAANDDVAAVVSEYMPEKFVEKNVEDVLEKYNGANALSFSLKGLISGVLSNAAALVKQRQFKQETQGRTQSLEGGAETFGQQTQDAGALDAFESMFELGAEGDIEDKEQALDKMFNKIINDPKSDILSIFVENKLMPEYERLKKRLTGDISQKVLEKIRPLITPGMSDDEKRQLVSKAIQQDMVEASAELDAFYFSTFKKIKENYGESKRVYEQRGQKREYSLREVQEEVDRQVENLNLDEILDYIYKQNFYELPKWAKKLDENLVKRVFKAIIKSELIINAKEAMDVSLPGASVRGQGGHAKLAQISIVAHILKKEIRQLVSDPETQEAFINQALNALGSKVDKETGEWVHKPKDTLQYKVFQHVTPAVMAAYLQKSMEMYGEKFAELTPEEQETVIEQVHSAVYKGAKLPYTYDVGMNELKAEPYHKVKDADVVTRQNIQERLQQAMDIQSGKGMAGKFMKQRIQPAIQPAVQTSDFDFNSDLDDLDDLDDFGKESSLSYMIKKYAFKH